MPLLAGASAQSESAELARHAVAQEPARKWTVGDVALPDGLVPEGLLEARVSGEHVDIPAMPAGRGLPHGAVEPEDLQLLPQALGVRRVHHDGADVAFELERAHVALLHANDVGDP